MDLQLTAAAFGMGADGVMIYFAGRVDDSRGAGPRPVR